MNITSSPNTHEVQDFYDGFLEGKMVSYRIDGNPRLDAAIQLIDDHVESAMVIADVGCGIGIITEAIAKKHPETKVIGIDLSPKNIEYCKKTIDAANTKFLTASITEQFDILRKEAPGGYDLVCLIDVIEHIPSEQVPHLLHNLASLLRTTGKLILAYPSPEYQKYLHKNESNKLQVIDNIVEIETLLENAGRVGLYLQNFSYKDIWKMNQYCHAVFSKRVAVEPIKTEKRSLMHRVFLRLDRLFLRPRRVDKYLKKPFQRPEGRF